MTTERLVAFLYLLPRDGRNNAGEIEQFVRQAEETVKDFATPYATPYAVTYSNEFLEGYAKELASRLLK